MTADRAVESTTRPGAGASAGVVAVAAALAAALIVGVTIQLMGPPVNDPDSAASVLFWRHLSSGTPLGTFVSTTPKPFLTILYGITFDVTGDWRSLAVLTLGAFGLAVAAAVLLARRVAGWGAAVFLVTALTFSPAIAIEVSRGNSLIWAIAGWLIAGAALTARPARPWIAGAALLVALSTRTETALLLGPMSLWIAGHAITGSRAAAHRHAPVLVAWLAVPFAAIHDLALTGDPTSWLRVPAGYTALVGRYEPPAAVLMATAERLATMPVAVVLAIVGAALLARRREWPALAAIVALTVGIVVFLVAVSWRRVYVTPRYLEQADIGLLLAAAVAVGMAFALVSIGLAQRSAVGSRFQRAGQAAAFAVAVIAGLAANPGIAPFDVDLATELSRVRAANHGAELVLPTLRVALADAQGTRHAPAPIDGPGGLTIVDPEQTAILVPRLLINRLLVDLRTEETWLGDSFLAFRGRDPLTVVQPGQVVYHDRAADLANALFDPFEIDRVAASGSILLEPLFVLARDGVWVVAIGATQ